MNIPSPYEVHITIDPVIEEGESMALANLAREYDFVVDETDEYDNQTILRGQFKSLEAAKKSMLNCIKALKEREFGIKRGKITHILLDLRLGNETERLF